MNSAVDLVAALRSQGLIDERVCLELTRLAVALDDAAARNRGQQDAQLGLTEGRPSPIYETALCRFFGRLAQLLVRYPADLTHWIARSS